MRRLLEIWAIVTTALAVSAVPTLVG